MIFWIGRGFAEVQILKKKWNWPYHLKLFEYFDKIMHKHCYWRELGRETAKCHLSSVEAMPKLLVYFDKICIPIAIDMI